MEQIADKSFEDDPRYSGAGKLAPKSHADFAFLEHMIYHMDPDDGRIAVLLPHGVLFRGGAEEAIRKYIVRGDHLQMTCPRTISVSTADYRPVPSFLHRRSSHFSGSEEAIRKYIVRDLNRLDAVIGLPANLIFML